jgi:hypothetical protein
MPELTDDGRAALHTISDALNTLEEDAFGRWDAMNDVATAVGLDWQTATQDGILGRIKSALARAEVLEVAFGNSHQLNEQLGNENRALLARAEAAEARVAELEAQLAAQGWRPVTITEPSLGVTVELIVVGYRGDGYWHYPEGPRGLVIRGWRPVPVAATEENQQ